MPLELSRTFAKLSELFAEELGFMMRDTPMESFPSLWVETLNEQNYANFETQ